MFEYDVELAIERKPHGAARRIQGTLSVVVKAVNEREACLAAHHVARWLVSIDANISANGAKRLP